MPIILNPFPSLLVYSFYAPFFLRILIAGVFLEFGYYKLTKGRSAKGEFFEKLGLKPGVRYVTIMGIIELLIGLMSLVGFYTQIAALAGFIILVVTTFIKQKHPDYLPSESRYYFVLALICFSLLLTGAGAYAVDW